MDRMYKLRPSVYRDRKDQAGNTCSGLSSNEEVFKDQVNKSAGNECNHEEQRLRPGEDVGFRVFPSTKHGRRWKRGVILGVGEDIIAAAGDMVGDQ